MRACLIAVWFTLTTSSGCAQPSHDNRGEQQKMEEAIKKYKHEIMYNKIQKMPIRPLYVLQVNKNNCRVLVSCNDIPHWITFFENIGESQGIYLNDYILKSGDQSIKVHVYPKDGQAFIADNADVDLKIKYAKDRDDDVRTYLDIAQAKLPEDIGGRKLAYYEISIPFKAMVPWDQSSDLELAKNLSEIPDIEKKVLDKYEELRQMLLHGDGLSFLKEIAESDLRKINNLYFTKEEILSDESFEDTDVTISRTDVKNRTVFPLTNYEIIFSHQGKLVHLRNKDTKDDMIGVSFDTEEETNGSQRMLLLYMPERSNELKVW